MQALLTNETFWKGFVFCFAWWGLMDFFFFFFPLHKLLRLNNWDCSKPLKSPSCWDPKVLLLLRWQNFACLSPNKTAACARCNYNELVMWTAKVTRTALTTNPTYNIVTSHFFFLYINLKMNWTYPYKKRFRSHNLRPFFHSRQKQLFLFVLLIQNNDRYTWWYFIIYTQLKWYLFFLSHKIIVMFAAGFLKERERREKEKKKNIVKKGSRMKPVVLDTRSTLAKKRVYDRGWFQDGFVHIRCEVSL